MSNVPVTLRVDENFDLAYSDEETHDLRSGLGGVFELNIGMIEDDGPSPGNVTASDKLFVEALLTEFVGESPEFGKIEDNIDVLNVDPEIGEESFVIDFTRDAAGLTSVSLSGAFTDPGVWDDHTLSVQWADGIVTAGSIAPYSRSFQVTRTTGLNGLDVADLAPVTFSITDDDSGGSSHVVEFASFDWQIQSAYEYASGINAGNGGDQAEYSFDSRIYNAETHQIWFTSQLRELTPTIASGIEAMGIDITYNSLDSQFVGANLDLIEGWATPDQLDQLRIHPAVGLVSSVMFATRNRSGNVGTEGEAALRADDVLSAFEDFGVDGTGITIGVLSGGYDHLADAIANNELPATVTRGGSGVASGDEGTAVLEIIHDLAPGATLLASDAPNNTTMEDAVDWMMGLGVDIIVDDIGFYPASNFTDDTAITPIAQDAIDNGAIWVSAAGNDGRTHYQGNWNPNASGNHMFDAGTTRDFLRFEVPEGGTAQFDLQWSDEWDRRNPSSSNDFTIELYDQSGMLLASSPNVQNGNDLPQDFISWTHPMDEDEEDNSAAQIDVRITANGVAAGSRELELRVRGNSATDALASSEDATFGIQALEDVITVAAINASDPGQNTVSGYSSRGGATILDDPDAQTFTLRDTIDVAGIDGVSTFVGEQGFFSNPFFGTSAAAPHVAAIAALIMSADDRLSPNTTDDRLSRAEVTNALNNNAVDIEAAGYDNDSGFGRADALSSVYSVFTPDAPDLETTSDTGASNTDNITGDATPRIEGTVPAGSFVRLFRNGVFVGSDDLPAGDTTFAITPTLPVGVSQLTITVAENSTSVQSRVSDPLSVTVVPPDTPTIDLLAISDSGRSTADNITNDRTPSIRLGSGNATDLLTVTRGGTTVLNNVPAGDYTLSTQPTGSQTYQVQATSADGLQSGTATLIVTYDVTAPTGVTLDLLASSDTGMSNSDDITTDTTPTMLLSSSDSSARYDLTRGGTSVLNNVSGGIAPCQLSQSAFKTTVLSRRT